MIALLMLACTTPADDTQTTDTDTGAAQTLTDDERAAMDSWADTTVTVSFGETSVQADRLVFLLPLDPGADLPDLDVLFDLEVEGADAKAQDYNSSRSNRTGAVDVGGDDLDAALQAFTLTWNLGEPCLGTYEACMSGGSPAELTVVANDPTAAQRLSVQVGHTFDAGRAHGGPIKITKRIDKATPLLMVSGDQDTGTVTTAAERLAVYNDGALVGVIDPAVDTVEVSAAQGSALPTGFNVERVTDGALISLDWGDASAPLADDRDALTLAETEALDTWGDQGVLLLPSAEGDLKVQILGLTPTSTEAFQTTVDLTLDGRPVAVGLMDGWSEDKDVRSDMDALELALNGVDCPEPCSSWRADGDDILLRKRPGRIRYDTAYGAPSGSTLVGTVALEQGDQTLTLTYAETGTTLTVSGTAEGCALYGWTDGKLVARTEVPCNEPVAVTAGVPIGYVGEKHGDDYQGGLIFSPAD